MEKQPKYVGSPKDLAERVRHEFVPAFKRNVEARRFDEVAGILSLQMDMAKEILVFEANKGK